MKLYLAGPMSGYKERNFSAFNQAAKMLRAEMNHEHQYASDDNKAVRAICMRRNIEALMTCDAVATLVDWQASKGARCEIAIAEQLNMSVRPFEFLCAEYKNVTAATSSQLLCKERN